MTVIQPKWGNPGYNPFRGLAGQARQVPQQVNQWRLAQRVKRARKSLEASYPWSYPIGFTTTDQDITESKAGAAAAYASVWEARGAVDAILDGINFLDWNIKHYPDGVRSKQEGEIIANRNDLKPRHIFQRELTRFRKRHESDLLSLIAYDYLLYGEVYIEKATNIYGRNPTLEWLNPLGVTPFYTNTIDYFRYGWNMKYLQIAPENMAYWHNRNPRNDFIGLPTVLTVMDKANILRNLDRFLRDYFDNNALPGVVVSPADPEGTLSDQDYNKFKALIKEQLKGIGGQFRTIVSQAAISVNTFDQPDLAKNITVADRNSEAILKVFRVPGVMLGSTANNPYKDSDEARDWFYKNVVIPLAKDIQQFFNVELMSAYDNSGNTIFEFDTSAFDEVTAADQLEANIIDLQVKGTLLDLYTAAQRQEIKPDDALKDLYMVEGVPVPKSELNTYWEKKLLVSPSVFNAPEITGEPLPAPTNPASVVPTDTGGEPVADEQVREELAATDSGADVPRNESEQQKATAINGHTYAIETRPYLPPLDLQKAQLAEIKEWERFVLRRLTKAAKDIRPFVPDYLRGSPSQLLQLQLHGVLDQETIKATFANAREKVAFKSIQATRLDFENAFEDAIGSAMAGKINRAKWAARVRNLIKTNINKAYRDGLADGGVLGEPEDSEQEEINSAIKTQSQYVTDLGARLFKEDKVTPAMADQKATMWWNKSVMPSYYAGFESAAANQMMEFVGDDGKENCRTCRRLKGQRHRLDSWNKKGLNPKGKGNEGNFECGLWFCEHFLQQTTAKAFGRW